MQTIEGGSGKIKIHELVSKFDQNDVLVWDNFPDDLVKRDGESGGKALEIVSSKDVKILLVALKPKYRRVVIVYSNCDRSTGFSVDGFLFHNLYFSFPQSIKIETYCS
jgi:hypothetical protein